jgi:hypothetical protein
MRTITLFFISFLLTGYMQAQVAITGAIKDAANGEPIPGVNIVEKGTTNGTISDIDGIFKITVSGNESVIMFSSIGYLTEEITVGDKTTIDLNLSPDLVSLEEVVVVGYGTQKKSVVTGAIAKVDQEILDKSRNTRLEQTLQGQTAGVVIMNNSGQPGDNLTVRIRGLVL